MVELEFGVQMRHRLLALPLGELAAVRLTERVSQQDHGCRNQTSPSQSSPFGEASSPIGEAKGCAGSSTPNDDFPAC